MPLYSVQKYVQGLLNGLAMPNGVPGPLVAWVTPPAYEKIKEPRAYVLGGHLRSARQSAPRGLGFRRYPWVVDIWVQWLDTPDDARENEPFPKVIDTITAMFEAAVMPVFIDASGTPVGPNTASAGDTQIQAIGETWSLEYPPERMPATLRMVYYTAHIGMDVLEVRQA